MKSLESEINQFCETFRTRITKAESLNKLELEKQVLVEEAWGYKYGPSFVQKIINLKNRYKIDLEEINREMAREKLNAKLYRTSGPNKGNSRQLGYYEQSLKKLNKERALILKELQNLNQLKQQLEDLKKEVKSKRVSLKGEEYVADESLAGERCGVCLGDVEVGMKMVRLSCGCKHIFCYNCVLTWFDKNCSCPICRQ